MRAWSAVLFSAATLLAGCAADATPDDTEAAADAVVAGSETYERPEVGIVWNGGGLCTGTLVRANVVLTAAHCITGLPKDEDATAAQPAYAFEIRRVAGDRQRFAVDRIHSFLTPADFDGTQRWRTKDIALVRLASDVPASIARPNVVARAWPRLGSRVAIYGYGCSDRNPGADGRRPGAGTKRKKEYRWSLGLALGFSDTENSCPGDSGGPLLDVQRGAVFGTTSGYVAGSDHFGDVPANAIAVDALADRWAAR